MAVKFNPFSGQLQIDEKGASASYIDGEVATYNDLPLSSTTAPLDSAWLVRTASGVWPVARKQAGIYIRTATGGSSRDADFTYAGTMPDVFSDAVLTIYDEASTTRTGQFNLGSITAGQNRVLTWPDGNGTIARLSDISIKYTLVDANFTAEAGKNYAVDAHPVAAVYPTFTHGGLVFTAKSPTSTATITWENDGDLYRDSQNAFVIQGTEILGAMINFINGNDFSFTVSLGAGAELTDSFPDDGYQEYTFSGGSAAGFTSVEATLPANPSTGDVVGFADARGQWGNYPLLVLRNGEKIEGGTANFTNNAAGTFFAMVYIDNTTGWRVLSSGTKPLNLTAPTIAGSYYFTATPGTWTGSPTSFAYQWQMSDDGETGWADIEGATGSTYLAVEADTGKFVQVGVTATNSNGPSAVVYSAASSAIDVPDFPTSGLLAFYKLDNVNDASGNSNTLTNNNTATFVSGKIGNAVQVTGGQYLSNNSLLSTMPSAGTFALWVYAPSVLTGVMIARYDGATTGGAQIIIDGGSVVANLRTPGQNYVTGYQHPVATWFHAAMTWDNGTLKLYVDGQFRNSTNYITIGSPNTPFLIAATSDGGTGNFSFIGKIDAAGVWNRALTSQEIATLYNNGTGLEP